MIKTSFINLQSRIWPDSKLPSGARRIKRRLLAMSRKSNSLSGWDLSDYAKQLLMQSLDIKAPYPSNRSSPSPTHLTLDLIQEKDLRHGFPFRQVDKADVAEDSHYSCVAALRLLGDEHQEEKVGAHPDPQVQKVLYEVSKITYTKVIVDPSLNSGNSVIEYCLPSWFDFKSDEGETRRTLGSELRDLAGFIGLVDGEPQEYMWNATERSASTLLILAAQLNFTDRDQVLVHRAARMLAAASCLNSSARGLTMQNALKLEILGKSLSELFSPFEIEKLDLELAIPDFGGPA